MFSPRQRSIQLREQRAAAVAAMSTIIERATSESRAINAEESAEFDRREAEVNGIDAQLVRVEAVERAGRGAQPIDAGLPGLRVARTMREAIEQSGIVARALTGERGVAELPFSIKALMLRTLVGAGNDGYAVAPTQLAGVVGYYPVLNRIVERLPSVPVSGPSAIYNRIRMTDDSPNGAAIQSAEGDTKARTYVESVPMTTPVKTYPTSEKISTQLLADAPAVAALVEQLMRENVMDFVDSDCYDTLTFGGNFQTFTPTSGETALESAARIATALATKGSRSILIALNPEDLLEAGLAKADNSGVYLGMPVSLQRPGVSVIESASVASGSILGLDVSGRAAQYADRESIGAVIGLSDDDLVRNLRTLLVECRGATLVRDPNLIYFGDATSA